MLIHRVRLSSINQWECWLRSHSGMSFEGTDALTITTINSLQISWNWSASKHSSQVVLQERGSAFINIQMQDYNIQEHLSFRTPNFLRMRDGDTINAQFVVYSLLFVTYFTNIFISLEDKDAGEAINSPQTAKKEVWGIIIDHLWIRFQSDFRVSSHVKCSMSWNMIFPRLRNFPCRRKSWRKIRWEMRDWGK